MLSKDMEEKPKLCLLKEIADLRVESSCATVRKKRERMMLVKLRGGTAPFQIEIGRWKGIARDERICKECESGEVEYVSHWLMKCPAWDLLQEPLTADPLLAVMLPGLSPVEQTARMLHVLIEMYRI